MQKVFLSGLMSFIFLMAMVAAFDGTPTTASVASTSNPSHSGGGHSSSRILCYTEWTTFDQGQTYEKRDVYIMDKGKFKVISGANCKMFENLNKARVRLATSYMTPSKYPMPVNWWVKD